VSKILQRVKTNIVSRRLLSRGQKVLVAVSGGVDSMVLLDMLCPLAAESRWQLHVGHFNHQLRGRASDADEKLVREMAARLKLRFFAESADVKAFAKHGKISVEMAARKLRHEFLARTAQEHKISTIALAHHADDQVELFFLRLLRGAGGDGLAGMKWHSPSPAGKNITLVRPLLDCAKAELVAFAREKKIRFRADATNFSADFLRNRIRNELLPLLRKNYQPAVDKVVLRLMDIVGAEAGFVDDAAEDVVSSLRLHRIRPTAKRYNNLPLAVQRKVLQSQLRQNGIVSDFDLLEALRIAPGKFANISPTLSVARDELGAIQLRRKTGANFNPAQCTIHLAGRAGEAEFAGQKIIWRIASKKGCAIPARSPRVEFFDAEKVGAKITLRHWRPGDRFQPIGMKAAVKLQDLFVNAKIPAARRRELLVATGARGEIFWVDGLRIGEKARLTPGTKRRLTWDRRNLPVNSLYR
jgi:tRNA(Ile)-lysidine synthase